MDATNGVCGSPPWLGKEQLNYLLSIAYAIHSFLQPCAQKAIVYPLTIFGKIASVRPIGTLVLRQFILPQRRFIVNQATAAFQKLIEAAQSSAMIRYEEALRMYDNAIIAPPGGVLASQPLLEALAKHGRASLLSPALNRAVYEAQRYASVMPQLQQEYISSVKTTIDVMTAIPSAQFRRLKGASAKALAIRNHVERTGQTDLSELYRHVQPVVDEVRAVADALGTMWPNVEPYNRLMQLYGPGCSMADYQKLSKPVLAFARTLPLSDHQPTIPSIRVPEYEQLKMINSLTEVFGLNEQRGKIVIGSRGKCCRLGPNNIRPVIEIETENLSRALYVTLHEGVGHRFDYEQRPSFLMDGLIYEMLEEIRFMEFWASIFSDYLPSSLEFWDNICRVVVTPHTSARVTPQNLWAARNTVHLNPEWGYGGSLNTTLRMILLTELEHRLINNLLRVDQIEEWYEHRLQETFGQPCHDVRKHVLRMAMLYQGSFGNHATYLPAECGAAAFGRRLPPEMVNQVAEWPRIGPYLQQQIGHGVLMDYSGLMNDTLGQPLTAEDWIKITKQKITLSTMHISNR